MPSGSARADFDRCRRLAAKAAHIAVTWPDQSVRYTHLARRYPPVAHAVLAAALLAVGRVDEAWAFYQPLPSAVAGIRQGSLDVAALAFLPDLAVGLDDVAGCRIVRDLITRVYGPSAAMGTGTVFYRGSVARLMGELDLGCGDAAAATTHFEEGLRVDARPYIAHGRMGLARSLADIDDRPCDVRVVRQPR